MRRHSRRKFIGMSLGAASAATWNLGCARTSESQGSTHDIAIVGAGLSGLAAARELSQVGVDDFVVLEARDRVGGRTINHDIGGGYIAEGGGQWVGPTQTAILDLARELGVETFRTYLDGNVVVNLSGKRMTLPRSFALSPPTALLVRIDELAKGIPLDAPWNVREAGEWDRLTVAQWAEANRATKADMDRLRQLVALDLESTPEEVSFLYLLYYIRSAGGVEMLESFEGGAQDSRIVGGSQILSLKMAESLGDKLRLSTPVSRIHQDEEGVRIETLNGSVRARHAIMAMMPSLCGQIQFDPSLSESRFALQSHWKLESTALKINVVYDSPFWRDDSLSGLSFSDSGPTPFTTDNSPPDAELGVLLILSEKGLHDEEPERRKTEVLESLTGLFGPKAKSPRGYHEMDWSTETYSGGCVSPLGPGVLTQYGSSLRGSEGRIHWAGTEAAEVWTGYMDGAVRAGQTVARRLAEHLSV